MSNTQTLYLFKELNNYFNRKLVLKGIRSLDDIETNSKLVAVKDNCNISIGDGVHASLTINFSDESMVQYNNELINGEPASFPDYAIIKLETEQGVYELSRWFIIESNKLSYASYRLTLQRDVLADYFEDVKKSIVFLEKGFVAENSPLIFNNENMSFNQIKKGEILIKDISKCGWIVGYIAKQDENEQQYTIDAEIETKEINPDYLYDELPQSITDALDSGLCIGNLASIRLILDIYNDDYYARAINYFDRTGRYLSSQSLTNQMFFWNSLPIGNAQQIFPGYNIQNNSVFKCTYNQSNKPDPGASHCNEELVMGNFARGINSVLLARNCINAVSSYQAYVPEIMDYDNKIVELDSGAYVRIHVKKIDNYDYKPSIQTNDAFWTLFRNTTPNYGSNPQAWYSYWEFKGLHTGVVELSCEQYEITQEPISGVPIDISIPTTRNTCKDAAYDMFALPYGGINESQDKDTALRIATGLTKALGNRLYDLQLLPYCPCQQFIKLRPSILPGRPPVPDWDELMMTENYDYVSVKDEDENEITKIIFPMTSKQNFVIRGNVRIGPAHNYIYSPILDYRNKVEEFDNVSYGIKVLDQTYLFRFVSPNYASIFEFSVAKNNNYVEYVNVNLNYKPYSPFIRVAPNFQGLYNIEYTDQRGLICGGDYSLSIISNAWTNYEINNKNYQLIFDRQVQNLGVSQQIESEKQRMSMFNIIPTAMASAVGGTMLGGGLGGILGGGIALGTSLLNQSMQADWLGRSQKEAKSYLIDNFNYTLGNIKAIPNSLAKVSALNEVNKIFPFIEIYEATEEEKELFISKLHYNGMNFNKIVGFGSYFDSLPNEEVFIKGQMIRMDYAKTDSHITYQIHEELLKGIFIDKGDYTG